MKRALTLLSFGIALAFASAPLFASGDADNGKTKSATCVACHGADGNAVDPQYPRLAGQYNEYIQQALHEYKDGRRGNAVMKTQVANLSDQDIEDIAAYLQGSAPAKAASAAPPPKAPKQVAPCIACHGENGLGVDGMNPSPPTLAGQHVDYLEQALTSYRNGRRKNVVMDSMAALLTSDEDVKVAAAYFAGQPSSLATATTESK